MAFEIRWTEPGGAKKQALDGAKVTLERYVELLGKGFARVEIRDDSGKRMTPDDMAQLVVLETRDGL